MQRRVRPNATLGLLSVYSEKRAARVSKIGGATEKPHTDHTTFREMNHGEGAA